MIPFGYVSSIKHRLVLDETERILNLAYIVIECSYAYKQRVSSYRTCSGICHIHNLKRMLERAGRFLFKFLNKSIGCVCKFRQSGIRYQVEDAFEQICERETRNRKHGGRKQIHRNAQHSAAGKIYHPHCQIHQYHDGIRDKCVHKLQPAFIQAAEQIHRHNAPDKKYHIHYHRRLRKEKYREEGDCIHYVNKTVFEEGLQKQGAKAERNQINQTAFHSRHHNPCKHENPYHHNKIEIKAFLRKNFRIGEMDGKENQKH